MLVVGWSDSLVMSLVVVVGGDVVVDIVVGFGWVLESRRGGGGGWTFAEKFLRCQSMKRNVDKRVERNGHFSTKWDEECGSALEQCSR